MLNISPRVKLLRIDFNAMIGNVYGKRLIVLEKNDAIVCNNNILRLPFTCNDLEVDNVVVLSWSTCI